MSNKSQFMHCRTVGVVTHIDIVCVACLDRAIGVLGEQFVATRKWTRPVHEIEIDVFGVEILQRRIACLFNIVRVVAVIPQLSGDKNLLSWHAASLDAFSDCTLRPVTTLFQTRAIGELEETYTRAVSIWR